MIKVIVKKDKLKQAFTIAEMLVVLLIISIVSISFILLMQHKINKENSSANPNNDISSLWTKEDENIYYGFNSGERVVIGSDQADLTSPTKLQIKTSPGQSQILLKQEGTTIGRIHVGADNSVVLGNYTPAANAVAIGPFSGHSVYPNSVTINGSTTGDNAVAIGRDSNAPDNSIAIGPSTTVTGSYGIAVGYHTNSSTSGIALGSDVSLATNNAVYINERGVTNDCTTAINYAFQKKTKNDWSIENGTGYEWSIKHGADTYVIDKYSENNVYNSIDDVFYFTAGKNSSSNVGIAIGQSATVASGNYNGIGVAIGYNARATGQNSYAIGANSVCGVANYMVIGPEAQSVPVASFGTTSTSGKYFLLGTNASTVLIPGSLSVNAIPIQAVLSDRKLKNIKAPFKKGINEIKKIKVYNYTFKNDKEKIPQVGVIAQEVRKVFPESVVEYKKTLYVKRNEIFYALFNSLKELNNKYKFFFDKVNKLFVKINDINEKSQKYLVSIKQKEKRILALNQKNRDLEKRISKLEHTIK